MIETIATTLIVCTSSVLLVYWSIQAWRVLQNGGLPRHRRPVQSERDSVRERERKRA